MSQFNDYYRKRGELHFNSSNSVGFLGKKNSKEKIDCILFPSVFSSFQLLSLSGRGVRYIALILR